MRPIYIEKMHFGTETIGLNSEGGLNFEWPLLADILLYLLIRCNIKAVHRHHNKSLFQHTVKPVNKGHARDRFWSL